LASGRGFGEGQEVYNCSADNVKINNGRSMWEKANWNEFSKNITNIYGVAGGCMS